MRWARGATLAERAAATAGSTIEVDLERALKRRDRWRSLAAFAEDPALFRRRLALDGLDEESVLPLLGEGDEHLAARLGSPPEWARRLETLWAAPGEPVPWPPRADAPADPFLELVSPIARAGLDRLTEGIAGLAAAGGPTELPFGLDDPAATARLFLGALSERLRALLTRTLVLELQIARLEERLAGETPEERFTGFVAGLRRPEVALEILGRYPVLARLALERVDRWVEASLELVERLATDAGEIVRRFAGGADPGPLAAVRGGLSDPHRGGRSVHVLTFASGLRLVYKPKSLALDAAFRELVGWLAEHGLEPVPRTPEVLDRGRHGWVELVAAAPCRDEEELARFFRRHGVLLALLYVLEGTDVHFENLIAAGEHPVPIDLETLLHPRVNVARLDRPDETPGGAFWESVLRTGLLPEKVWGDGETPGVDLSGLGSAEGGLTRPFWVPVGEGSDAMRYEYRSQRVAAVENRPTLRGAAVEAEDHAGEVVAGFRAAYRLLLALRDELAAPDGPLAAFAGAETRVVVRPTRAYGMLLAESGHPQVLGDAVERDLLLDRIWAGIGERPFLERLVPAERRDLAAGDVPMFTTRSDSRDLWTARGEHLPEVLAESGLERVRRRLATLGADDLERQAWTIGSALAVPALDKGKTERPSFEMRPGEEPPAAEELLAWARRAGDQVVALGYREADRSRWLTAQPLAVGNWALLEVPPDGYLGVSGIALFLAHLGAATGEERYRREAERAVATLRWMIRDYPGSFRGIGAFNGWGAAVYAFALLADLWRDEALLDEAEALLPRIEEGLAEDRSYDLLAGAAGALASLLVLHRLRPASGALDLACRCGEHLVAAAVPQERGAAWRVEGMGERPLAGVAHGAAGIALPLLELSAETGDERFRRAARAAIEYERSWYSEERRNWPDLRDGAAELADLHGDGEEHFMCAWCQGAPGIGLARLAGLEHLDDPEVRREIAVAVETTLAEGFGTNHSLCHGALGNLDFLARAARTLGDRELARRCGRLASGVLESFVRDGWLFGLARGAEPIGLMAGLAGVGYGLLRLARPESVPDLLTVRPPAGTTIRSGARRSRHSGGPAVMAGTFPT